MEAGYDSSARGNAANIPLQGHTTAAGGQNCYIQNDQGVDDAAQGISDDLESWNPMEDDFTNLAFNAYREPTPQELRQWMPKPDGSGPSEDLLAIYRSRDGDVRLFVNGIPNEMTQEGIQGLFSQVGKLVYCKVIPQRDPSRIDKFGFVGYKSYREAEHAIRKFDGFLLGKNMKLKVSLAKEKPKFPENFPWMEDNVNGDVEEDSENDEQDWGPPATPLNLTASVNGDDVEPQGQAHNPPCPDQARQAVHNPSYPDQERQGSTNASACNGEAGVQPVSKKPIGAVLEPLPCSKCGKDGRRRCGNCKIPYCSKECQRSDWSEHKTFCNWKNAQEKPQEHSTGTSVESTFNTTPSSFQIGSDNMNVTEEQPSVPNQDPYSLNEDDFDISEISQFANLMGIRMVPQSPGDSPSPQNCELNNNQRRGSGSGRCSPSPSPQESHYGYLQPLKKASTKPLITEISSSVPEPVGSRGGSSRSTPIMDEARLSSGASSPAIGSSSDHQTSLTTNEKPAQEPQERPYKRFFANEVPHQNLTIGGSYEIVATSVSSPTLFWAQLYEQSALANQNYLFQTIKAEYENSPYKTYVPSPNELCIAQFSLDNTWYRSKVDYIGNNGLIRVTHLDFGSSEDVEPTKIRRIKEELVRVPRQGVKCALHLPECPATPREWCTEEIEAFRSRVLDVKYRVEVKDIKDSVLHVDVFDSKDNSRINDIFKDKQKERANVVKPEPVYPQSAETSEQLSSLYSMFPQESVSTRGLLEQASLRARVDSSSSRGSSPSPSNIPQVPANPVTQEPVIPRREEPSPVTQAYSTHLPSNRVSPMLDSGNAFLPIQNLSTDPSGSAVRSAESLSQESQSYFSAAQTSETYYGSATNPGNRNPSPGMTVPQRESPPGPLNQESQSYFSEAQTSPETYYASASNPSNRNPSPGMPVLEREFPARPLNQESQSYFSEAQTSPETYYASASNPSNRNPSPGVPVLEREFPARPLNQESQSYFSEAQTSSETCYATTSNPGIGNPSPGVPVPERESPPGPLNQESQSYFSEAQTSPETYYGSATNSGNRNPSPGVPVPQREIPAEPLNQVSHSYFREAQTPSETYYSRASNPGIGNPSPVPQPESPHPPLVRSTPPQSSSRSSSEVEFPVRSPGSPMLRPGVVHRLTFKGVVTSVKSPWEFTVNMIDPQFAEQLDQLTYDLNTYCSTAPFDAQKVYSFNELCAVKLNDDRTWHRGKVIANFQDEGYKVVFIDVGGENVLAAQKLRAMPQQFQVLEPQCRVCSLGGVRKPAGSLVWGKTASDRFSSLVLHRSFTFKEINRHKHSYLVDVLDEAGQPSVAAELISAGLADPYVKKVQWVPDTKERPMGAFIFPLPIKQAITSARLPPPNTTFQIIATDIQSPASFFVQLVDQETNQSLSDLCAEMNKYYADSTAHPDWKPKESEMCAIFLKGSWFRAHIGSVGQDSAARIYCVDFGNSEVVSTSVMRPLAPMFQNLPYCALRCSLGNIVPVEGEEWSKEATDFMKLRIPMSSTMNARLIYKGQSILFLDVFVSSGNGVESILKLLVTKGLAKFKSKKEVSPEKGTSGMPKDRIEGNLGPYALSVHGCAIAAATLPNAMETFQGKVTELKATGEMYVQIADEALTEQLMELTRAMNSFYNNAIPTKFEAKQNLLCAAKFFADWRRAYILRMNSSETATVYDVDFGKTETLHVSQLQFLQPQFTQFQYCSLQCKLSLPRGISWTKEACDLFVSKVKFHVPTTIRLISKRKEILFIDVLVPESSQTLVQMIISQSQERSPILEGASRVPKPRYPRSPPKMKETGTERTVKSLNFEKAIAAARLPEVGHTFDAVITEYLSPHCFYIQSAFEMVKKLNMLSVEMNNYYNAVPKAPFQPVENQLCVALFGAPNEWYRALVEKINPNQTATVFYVDYGNTGDVPMADLRQLEDRFSDLPYCALNTSLADVMPKEPSGWSSDASSFVKSRLQVSVRMRLKLVAKRQDVLHVDWVDPASGEASLCSEMVKNGFAYSPGNARMSPTRSMRSASNQRPSPSRREDVFASGNLSERSPSISSSSPRSYHRPFPSPQESAITSANLPPFKETFQVIATHMTSPGSFAVQIADFEMASKVAELGRDMTGHYHSAQYPPFSPAANQMCVAQFTGNDEWYRGWIESVTSSDKVHIYYPDYGNSEDLHVSRLRPLEQRFTALPYASLSCSIAHVVPPEQEEWKQEAIDMFTSSIPLYHPINVKLVFKKRDRLFLDITDPSDNSTTLSKTLVERGLAVWMVYKKQNKEATEYSHGRPKYEESNRASFVPNSRAADSQVQPQVFGAHGVDNVPRSAQETPTPMANILTTTNRGGLQSQLSGGHGVNNLSNSAEEIPSLTSIDPYPTNQGRPLSQVSDAHGTSNLPSSAEEYPSLTSIDPYPTNQGRPLSQVSDAHGTSNLPSSAEEYPSLMSIDPYPTNQGKLQSQLSGAHGVNTFPNPAEEIPSLTSIDPYSTNQERPQSQESGNLPNQVQEAQITNQPTPTNRHFLQSLPLVAFPRNEYFNAMVCDIKNTGAVSLQVLTQELKDLDPLCAKIGQHCSQIDHSPYCPIEGELCLACFSQDKNWYRAVVNGVLPNNLYQVTFLDYGNDDTISPNDIRKVEQEFLHLPRQAYTGILAGLPRSHMGGMLEDDVLRALSAKLLEKRVFACVNDSRNEVEFFDVGFDEKPSTSINQELFQR